MKRMIRLFKGDFASEMNSLFGAIDDILKSFIQKTHSNDETELFELKLILNELFFNAAKHGNQWQESKYIRVHVFLLENRYILVGVEDEGSGYDYHCMMNDEYCQTQSLEFNEGGRGLMIVKHLCTKIRFNPKGNRIVVMKKIAFNLQ